MINFKYPLSLKMTKDWDLVQDEIKDLSFNQKMSLKGVKELMERKHKFRASTRAYRIKLKEWGLMRHSPRRVHRETKQMGGHKPEMSDTTDTMSIEPQVGEHCAKTGDAQAAGNPIADAAGPAVETTYMGLFGQPQNLPPSVETWSHNHTQATDILLDMIGAILDNDVQKLEKLVLANTDRINDPIGLPFDQPDSRFFAHPALSKMSIRQHPGQTLFDVACGMPSGPVVCILIAYGAKGSKYPLSTDLALYNAIKNERTNTVQALLQPGRSEVNGLPGTTWRPLQQAVFWNTPEVVRILIARGARVDDFSLSPCNSGVCTALQLCLSNRISFYAVESDREKCHTILQLLINAGANVHSSPPDPAMRSNFHMFTQPWQNCPHWALQLSESEIACFSLFASKGVCLQTPFGGCPCGSSNQDTFQHQALWHSTPSFARIVIDSFVPTSSNDGMSLLYGILGSCPNAKRHPAYTQRDMQVLFDKGVGPNGTGQDYSPLQVCISASPAIDVVSRLQVLLARGADPEAKDENQVQPYVLASDLFQEPLRSEVMSLLVAKMSGTYVQHIDGVLYSWSKDHFPIPKTPTYEQVMACTDGTSAFARSMYYMVPERAQNDFRTAYFQVISGYFLESTYQLAKTNSPHTKEMHQKENILHLREFGLPKIAFQKDLMDAVNTPLITSSSEQSAVHSLRSSMSSNTAHAMESSSFPSDTIMATNKPIDALLPFQYNVNDTMISNDPTIAPDFQQGKDDFSMAEALLTLSWEG
ncbi:high affinity nitrate transporter [Pyrenophora seminiperda CCB06]|uniref:High affinity nitrate transporter n=1 Tax=Pyrenophora seminiperda CCB06 TaxID=1302712 RepID=A0A3M7M0S9_9PLEO|nr:high affinity nitrate transporter [Pyrenophora seminiperda CCB06]